MVEILILYEIASFPAYNAIGIALPVSLYWSLTVLRSSRVDSVGRTRVYRYFAGSGEQLQLASSSIIHMNLYEHGE